MILNLLKRPGAVARSVANPFAITCCMRTRDRHPHPAHIFFRENISTAILLPLIHEEELSV